MNNLIIINTLRWKIYIVFRLRGPLRKSEKSAFWKLFSQKNPFFGYFFGKHKKISKTNFLAKKMKIELKNTFLSSETGFLGYRIYILRPEGKWMSIFNGFWRGLKWFAHNTKLWMNTVGFFYIFLYFFQKFVRDGIHFEITFFWQ